MSQGLIGRVILVLMCAVLAEFLGSSLLYERVELHASRAEQARRLAEQLVSARRVLARTAPADRPALARVLGAGQVELSWTGLPPVAARQSRTLRNIGETMTNWEPSLRGGLQLWTVKGDAAGAPDRIVAAAPLAEGGWVRASAQLRTRIWVLVVGGLTSAAILSAGVLASGVLLLRSVGAPLRALAHAAEVVGEGRAVQVREAGPPDLRRMARAFNTMQTRIADLLAARTRALAAVSHDLRTPLARLRLRAGLVAEPETRACLEQDVDEMNAMLDSLLGYLSGRHEQEKHRLADVAAICLTLVDAASDAGRNATYCGPERLMARIRPLSVKRALDNLIQNALTYAGRADVTLEASAAGLVLAVEDDGPGIPEDQMRRVIEPFWRLDEARARNTTGLGLGLSIVERIAADEGGELKLRNRRQGGLRAELRLPLRD